MKNKETGKDLFNDLKKSINQLERENQFDDKTLEECEDLPNIDHYHGQQHIDKYGNKDNVNEDEFKTITHFTITSKKNLTYKLVLTAIFLALSVVVSAIDMLTESIAIPIGQVYIQTRFLDIIVMLISLPIIGPWLASLLGVIEPILHNLMHGMEHGWIQPMTDAISNVIIILLTCLLFYIVFKNSPYHHDPNKKKDLFKRITPISIMIVLASIVSTIAFILALYIQSKVSNINVLPKGDGINFKDISSSFAIMTFSIFGVNILRYTLAYGFYFILEGKVRSINHRYR